MSRKKTKKYPVFTYLCLTLSVCALLTGVTFSRYTTRRSGDMESTVSRFSCSYEISDLSSTSFINSSFYLEGPDGGRMNTLRTVTYTVRNYQGDGADACGENLKSVLRIYGPYEFISDLAWQLERVENDVHTVVTPQLVMGDIIGKAPGNNAQSTYNTGEVTAYDARAYADTAVTLTGGIAKDAEGFPVGTVKGSWEAKDGANGGEFVFNAYPLEKASYSLSFLRTGIVTVNGVQVAGTATTPFIVDFEEKIAYCTLDVYLPVQMDFSAGVSEEKSFIMYFSIVNPIEGFANAKYTDYYDNADGTVTNAVGYHYDAKVAVRGADGNITESGGSLKTATVRVVRRGGEYAYYKVPEQSVVGAVLSELTEKVTLNGMQYIKDGENYYAVAELNDVLLSPEKAAYGNDDGYMISKCIDKVYNLEYRALFIQLSQNGGGA